MTFRLRAPEAKAVKVSGDFGADADMQSRTLHEALDKAGGLKLSPSFS